MGSILRRMQRQVTRSESVRIRVRIPQDGDDAKQLSLTFIGEAEAMIEASHDGAMVQEAMLLALAEFASRRGQTLHEVIRSLGASWSSKEGV
jgi:hypothetical protein